MAASSASESALMPRWSMPATPFRVDTAKITGNPSGSHLA
jgi:hypothetical protein